MKNADKIYKLMTQLLAELEAMEVEINAWNNNKFMVDRRILIRALKNFMKFF